MKNNDSESGDKFPQNDSENKLVRLIKSIVANPERGRYVDESIVKFKYYNSFNYSLLSKGHDDVHMTLGITSPKPGEGKTLVACNLAVSLAMGAQKSTVLVDLNIIRPRIHEIFGTVQSPGLAESFSNNIIHISHTSIEHLSVLTVGSFFASYDYVPKSETYSDLSSRAIMRPQLGLDQLAAFRDVVYSLEHEFEFVIVDMPSTSSHGLPVLFANQLHGLIVVVDATKTKREDIDAVFHQFNERQVLGFVFNRFKETISS